MAKGQVKTDKTNKPKLSIKDKKEKKKEKAAKTKAKELLRAKRSKVTKLLMEEFGDKPEEENFTRVTGAFGPPSWGGGGVFIFSWRCFPMMFRQGSDGRGG